MNRRHLWLAAVAGLLAAAGCIGGGPELVGEGQAWTEADELFRSSDRWLGSDGAFSVDLGDGRVLWLFGDTLVAPEGERSRDDAYFVSNTIAIQEGYDPTEASITFHWGSEGSPDGQEGPLPEDPLSGDEGSQPRAFFPDQDGIAHWPQDGILLDGSLIVFAHRIDRGDGGQFGFEGRGWTAYHIANPQATPGEWQVDELDTPDVFTNVSLGTTALVRDGTVLVYGVHSWEGGGGWTHHEPVLARWSTDAFEGERLPAPEWWAPSEEAWVASEALEEPPEPMFTPGAPGFTVFEDARSGRWVQVQTTGFGETPVELRSAPEPTGPWSSTTRIYDPPEREDEAVMTYGGLAHPHLEGAELVAVYSTNTAPGEEQADHEQAYYPRFVRVDLAEP